MNNKSSEITIVYIEDSDDVRFACEQTLTLAGYRVISCCDAEHSIPLIQSQANIIILTDVRLPGISGLELLSYINEMDSKIPVILITGHGDVEMAVDAMRNGAFDFIEKPSSSDKLLSIIARAVEKRRLVLENQQLLANLQQENGPVLIGRSPQMQQLRKMILNVADTGADVLIYGETGCGKEVVARMLHHWSTRRQGQFVALNCAGLPETLFESEIFGLMKTTDGKQMLTWVIYPPQFDPNKKYPTLLFCEGGPQSPVSQFWSYRWNFQIMAANDYIIVAPNRRGLPGFGVEWNEQISGDYGGQCMKDYFTAIDEIAKESYVDKDRLGCVGASFGGFSVYWLAGHHDKRFKAFIAHDGIFNMEMQYLETEEKWFANWDMGGAYWERQNPVAQRTFANSPHLFVEKWDTPILCIHGEKDYRILANQAMAAFDAAIMRGVPAELLIYPDENHWVLKPQNGVLWQRTFFEWLDKWVKKAPSE